MKKEVVVKSIIGICIGGLIFLIFFFAMIYPNRQFRKNEKILDEAGKRYFDVNRRRLPKEEGRVLSVALETLAKQKYLDDLFVPYKKETCDTKKSVVKAKVMNGEYQYFTYLKCGKYESSVDHEGPVITLNGKKMVTVNRGEGYQDPGVSSVKDKVNGNLAVGDVIVKGVVNTNKVGTYVITYTAKDQLNNKTTVKREVEVVENLANTVKRTAENGVYRGLVENNYLLFNNILFRIVRVNEDNSVLITSDAPLANVDYGSSTGRFTGSSLDKWLNDYFYNLLEKENKEMIAARKWCDDVIGEDYMKTDCTRYSDQRNIGILSLQDYNKTLLEEESFLDLRNLLWYMNFDRNNRPWTMTSAFSYPLKVEAMDGNYLLNVRVALNLKSNTKIVSGTGSIKDPYQVTLRQDVKRGSLLNTRQTGEYVSYSGYLWRLAGKEKDETMQVVMEEVLKDGTNEFEIKYNTEGKSKVYNPKEKGNIGYQINRELSKYVSTSYFANKKVTVPIYSKGITYQGKKEEKKYQVRLSAPSAFEIFSAKGKEGISSGFWLIESSKEENTKAVVNPIGTTSYDYADDYSSAGVKIRAYFQKDVYIKSGSGISSDPFIVTQ